MNKRISRKEAAEKIAMVQGRFFGVRFIKRTTGTLRRMTCRLGVSKGVTGAGRKFNPKDHSLLSVFSVGDDGYRMVPYEGLRSLSIGGEVFDVRD